MMTDARSPAGRPLSRLAGALAAVPVPALALVIASAVTSLLQPLPALGAESAAPSASPPSGRYRCYQPPRFSVVSWFDLEADGTYRAQGAAAAPYRYDAQRRQLRWLAGDHAERGWVGLYLPPAADGAGGIRHTIVMTSTRNLKPPAGEQDPRPQCYLTTH